MSEQDATIRDLQTSLMRTAEERDKWKKLYELSWKARFDHSWGNVEKFYRKMFGNE